MATAVTDRMAALVERLEGAKPRGQGWVAKCPAHADDNASLKVDPGDDGKVLIRCYAGCAASAVLDAVGLAWGDVLPPRAPRSAPMRETVYRYLDESGALAFEVVRRDQERWSEARECFEPHKTFLQRRPARADDDPKKVKQGWVWGTQGLRRVLYRLPELLARAEGERIYLVEGEKCVERLMAVGLLATTSSGGAQGWQKHGRGYAQSLRGADVVVLPDNDDPGREYADAVCQDLKGVVGSLRVVALPGLGPKGDVVDWLDAGGTGGDLTTLADECPMWSPPVYEAKEANPPSEPMPPWVTEPPEETAGTPSPTGDFPLTDTGNAERLISRHGHNLRWNAGLGWLVWNGCRWVRDERGEVHLFCKETVRAMSVQARAMKDRRLADRLKSWALRSEGAGGRRSTVGLAQYEPGVGVLASELDADPWLLNLENGTLDLRTGLIGEHSRGALITKMAPVQYDPAATAPTWERFLSEAVPDHNDRFFLQKFAGMCLTGEIREHVFLVCWGSGRNGKGTFFETLKAVMGEYAVSVPSTLFMARKNEPHPTEQMVLMGKRLAWASETKDQVKLDVGLVKKLTGGDTISARYIAQDFVEFTPTHKAALLCNHKPKIEDTTDSIWERVRLFPWTEQFTGARQDTSLPQKLRAESAGILNWLILGCMAWQRQGLGTTDNIRVATGTYREDMDVLGAFLKERCVVATWASAMATPLYQEYEAWCEEQHERPMPQRGFGMSLKERGFRNVASTAGRKKWEGIGIQSAQAKDARTGEAAERKGEWAT